MVLTHQRRISSPAQQDNSDFPTTQLFILAICRLAEPIALTSIFPYSWVMVKHFDIGDENSASFYAGILISSFALSESLTSMYWGGLSDKVGRKPVLILGCAGTLCSLLIVGFATNFWIALAGRMLGGALNGNIGIIQTMVAELVKKPEHEPRAYAVMPFVWSIGTIIGPAIGGTFANPVESLPSFFSPNSVFATFPYLLPNLICAALLLISIIAGYFYLIETHPDMQPWSTPHDLQHSTAQTPLMATAGATADSGVDLRGDSYGTFNEVSFHEEPIWTVNADGSSPPPANDEANAQDQVFTHRVVMLVIALGIFTYHSMTYDHLLPIFLQDNPVPDTPSASESIATISSGFFSMPRGLGLTTQQVGIIMSFNGLIALVIQAIVFPLFAEWLGVYRVFLLVTILHPIAYFIVPFIALLEPAAEINSVYAAIYACLTIRNFLHILAYPVILILLKEACPKASALGKVNGLAASVGAACRTVSPPVAGLLYGLGSSIGFTGVAWWGSGIVAVGGAIQLFWVGRQKSNIVATVRSAAPCILPVERAIEKEERDVVHILVNDV